MGIPHVEPSGSCYPNKQRGHAVIKPLSVAGRKLRENCGYSRDRRSVSGDLPKAATLGPGSVNSACGIAFSGEPLSTYPESCVLLSCFAVGPKPYLKLHLLEARTTSQSCPGVVKATIHQMRRNALVSRECGAYPGGAGSTPQ